MKLSLPYVSILCASALSLSLVACGGAQDRQKIGDRSGVRTGLKNSKLLAAKKIVKTCAGESGKKDDSKDILSLEGLEQSLTTSDALTLFASSFTSRIQILDQSGQDLKNKQLSQTYVLAHGLQHNNAPLSKLAPSLLRVVDENCGKVKIRTPEMGEAPSLFFQLARLDINHLNAIAQLEDDEPPETEQELETEPDTTVEVEIEAESEPTAVSTIEFSIDIEASSERMLVLKHPEGNGRIIIKVVNEETIQVITEKADQLVACGEDHSFLLRNEATLVWGKSLQDPVKVDYELYQTLLDLSNNPELLSNGTQKNESGRRAKGSTLQSVSLPEGFLGQFDDSIDQFNNGDDNVFDLQPVACD